MGVPPAVQGASTQGHEAAKHISFQFQCFPWFETLRPWTTAAEPAPGPTQVPEKDCGRDARDPREEAGSHRRLVVTGCTLMKAASPPGAASRRLRLVARILALAWAVFWSAFGLLSGIGGIGEGGGLQAVLAHTLMPGLVFLAAAVIAWRWELVGGLLLALAGLATIFVYPFATTAGGFPLLPLPGIVAGALCWAGWLARRWGG